MGEPETAAGPLHGLRIIDISAVMAGPFATQQLVELGADVIKVEPPEGDIMRFSGPSPVPGMSPIYQHMNRGKRSIVLDLKQPQGRAVLLDLVRGADAFVTNMRPKALDRLGLAEPALRVVNPALVYCSIVGYGQTGPYADRPAYDDLIQGIAGIPDLVGRSLRVAPRFVPFAICDRVAGLFASNALLAGIIQRHRTGKGSAIEVPMFEASVYFVLVEHLFGASFDPPVGAALNPRMLEPNRKPYRTADGHLCVLPYTTRHWQAFFDIIGRPALRDDPRFADFAMRRQHIDVLYQILDETLPTRATARWLADLDAADIPAAPVLSVEDLQRDPHLVATRFFQQMPTATGAFRQLAHPVRVAGAGPVDGITSTLAQDTRAILAELGYDAARIAALAAAGTIRAESGQVA